MTSKNEQKRTSAIDWLKWVTVLVLFLAGLFANSHYNTQPWPLRLLAWLILAIVMSAIALQTEKGRSFISFVADARAELRKVFWPTRQETVQTTLVVAAVVVLLALILWGIDALLMVAIGWLTR